MAKKKLKSIAPRAIGVKTIATISLVANPHNPRLLFDREPLDVLKRSIEKVGILVPLTVYKDSNTNNYVILDGQRRWICANELGLDIVPVNEVEEPSLAQNIVTMFQIHKLREDWELMPTALKLELLMEEIDERNELNLSEITGLGKAIVSRCKKLLSYPKKYQDMMLFSKPKDRIKADFFIELYQIKNNRLVNQMDWFKKNDFTDRMLDRYMNKSGAFKSVTDFRKMKQYINNARKFNEIDEITIKLHEFTYDDTLTLDHLEIESAQIQTVAAKILKDVEKLQNSVNEINVDNYYGEEKLWVALEKLVTIILKKLGSADRRFKF